MIAAVTSGPAVSAVSAAAMVLIAAGLDASAAGPDRFRDRVAGALAISGLYSLYEGSSTSAVVGAGIVSGVQSLTGALGGRWSEITAGALLTLLSGLAALCVIAAFGPDDSTNGSGESTAWRRFSSKLSLRPRKIRRLNTRIWAAAFAMAVFGPLAQGAIGTATSYVLHLMPGLLSYGIAWLFGIPA